MHILIIPSEQFLIAKYPLGDIHQAKVLKNADNHIVIISVSILLPYIKELGDLKMDWHIITIGRKND